MGAHRGVDALKRRRTLHASNSCKATSRSCADSVTEDEEKARAARQMASYVLLRMAATISAGLASFSSWMIVGCAAILGVSVANIETVTAFIPAVTIAKAIVLFLA